jgi:hypothetical protein
VWLADEKGAHLFDVKQMKFTQTLAWPKSAGAPRAADKVDERGNHAWIFAGNRIARLDDNAHPTLKVLFQTEKSGELAAGYDGKLYFTQGIELWAAPLEKLFVARQSTFAAQRNSSKSTSPGTSCGKFRRRKLL